MSFFNSKVFTCKFYIYMPSFIALFRIVFAVCEICHGKQFIIQKFSGYTDLFRPQFFQLKDILEEKNDVNLYFIVISIISNINNVNWKLICNKSIIHLQNRLEITSFFKLEHLKHIALIKILI